MFNLLWNIRQMCKTNILNVDYLILTLCWRQIENLIKMSKIVKNRSTVLYFKGGWKAEIVNKM